MRIFKWCVDIFRYYVVVPKSIFFILGLMFSYKLVQKALLDILITHLSDAWEDYDMRRAAKFVNLLEGTEAVIQIFFAFVADAYTGLFKMVVFSTTLHILGLFLSCFAASEESLNLRVLFPALVMMTLSQAAKNVTLKAFLGDQIAKEEEEEKAESRCDFWWNFISFLAAIVAQFGPSKINSLKDLSILSASAMGTAFLFFLLGCKLYKYVEPTGSPLSDVGSVIHNAIVKRNVEYPETPEHLFENSGGFLQISPNVSWLRWLDKAAVLVQERGKTGHVSSVKQVKGVKYLFKMFPMWTTFLTFSIVAASGSTFFLEEASSLNDDDFSILFFINLQRVTEFMVSGVSDYVLKKLVKKNSIFAQRVMLVRIGVGMIFSVLCCIAAWINAVHRLRLVRNYGNPKNYMSVYRLTPQYILLAIMEGLSEDGLENFFDSQVSRSIFRYGPHFGECVMGVGKFLSVVCVIIFSRWFKWLKKDVKYSQLDKYYMVLTVLSSANIILYCLVAYWYGDDRFVSDNVVDLEITYCVEAGLKEDSLGPLVGRSLSGKGKYSYRSLSGRIGPTPEESSIGDDPTAEKHENSSVPLLLKLETDEETDDIDPTKQVSESPINDSSDAPLLNAARSFERMSSKGIQRRFHSMR